jgi:predicted nucleotidyltransferase
LVGPYLRGSLALGDFIPETSDLDILAITETLVTETEFSRILALRHYLDTLSNPYTQRLEIAYIDRKNLGRFKHS